MKKIPFCFSRTVLLFLLLCRAGQFLVDHPRAADRGADGPGAMRSVPAAPFAHIRNKPQLHLAAERANAATMERLLRNARNLDGRDEEGNTPLHYAAANAAAFKEDPANAMAGIGLALINKGADVTATNKWGDTPLHVLACNDDVQDPSNGEAVRLLVEQGALVNARNCEGQTPLHWAAERNQVHMARALLELGAELEERDEQGRTALHYACREWQFGPGGEQAGGVISVLLEHGADVNASDAAERSPAHLLVGSQGPGQPLVRNMPAQAPQRNLEPRLRALLEAKPDLNVKDKEGKTVLLYAMEEERPMANLRISLPLLIEHGADPNARDDGNKTILHRVAAGGDASLAGVLDHILGAKGIAPNAQDDAGETPLHVAVRLGNADLARALVERGADPFVAAQSGDTAILLGAISPHQPFVGTGEFDVLSAVLRGELDTLKRIIEREPRLASARFFPEAQTLLKMATAAQHWAVSEILLDSGAELDPYSAASLGRVEPVLRALQRRPGILNELENDRTLLIRASAAGRMEMVRLLLERNADPLVMDGAGRTPLFFAQANDRKEAAELLRQSGPDVFALAGLGKVEELAVLFKKKPALARARSQSGWTPLHCAARWGRGEAVKLLLAQGAEVNARNQQGQTALHFSSAEGHIAVAAVLLENGGSVNAADRVGFTPLHAATMACQIESARLLLDQKADVNAVSQAGETPLSLAGAGNAMKEPGGRLLAREQGEQIQAIKDLLIAAGGTHRPRPPVDENPVFRARLPGQNLPQIIDLGDPAFGNPRGRPLREERLLIPEVEAPIR